MILLPFDTGHDVKEAAPQVAQIRAGGGVVLFPTETYYGLGADPANRSAVETVFALKERPPGVPLPVLVSDWDQLEAIVEVPDRHRVKLSRSWPGALTVVLPARRSLPAGTARTLAVRIPAHDRLRALLYRVGPLTGTSANRHGEAPCITVADALGSLGGSPDLVLDGGTTRGGAPSTLVDLTGDADKVLRPGPIGW